MAADGGMSLLKLFFCVLFYMLCCLVSWATFYGVLGSGNGLLSQGIGACGLCGDILPRPLCLARRHSAAMVVPLGLRMRLVGHVHVCARLLALAQLSLSRPAKCIEGAVLSPIFPSVTPTPPTPPPHCSHVCDEPGVLFVLPAGQ
jgi:hypothetical protein